MRRVLWCVLAAAVVLLPATPMGGERNAAQSRRPTQPDPGRVLRVGVTRVPTLDPAQSRSADQVLVTDQLFDSLTAADPETLEPVPALAERWQVSADQRHWHFFLRPGARFSNGRPITSADVKYTLERIARPGSGSPAADLLQPVSGFDPFRKGAAPQLAGVTTPAPNFVNFTLDQPWSVLPTVLSSPLFGVVARESAEATEGPSINDQPVSSGPFRMDGQQGETLVLVPAEGTKTRLGGIHFVRYEDVREAYRAFEDGRLDFSRVPADEASEAGRRYGHQAFQPYVAELFYGFNLKSPKFADPRFREAIVRGINRKAVVTAVYQNTVRPIDSTLIAGIPGHREEACARCQHDPQRARALLGEVFKGKPPPPVALDFEDDDTQGAIARTIQASLQEVGIQVILRPKAARDYDAFQLSDEIELFRTGWFTHYPSPDAILPQLFGSDSVNNLTGFSNPNVDAQLRAARAEANPARRLQLYQQADQAVMDLVPVVPIAQFTLHSVVAKRVKGLKLNGLGSFDATRVRVS